MLKVSIIGTGQIGYDLLHKLVKINFVKIIAFVGRRECTKQLPNNIFYSDQSIQYFISNPKCCDVVFDCTDAYSACINAKIFLEQSIKVIDLTPSNIGEFYIPKISKISNATTNINMVTCGGQVSIPLLNYLKNKLNNITYVEIVTQINSESAGLATRINIDKYIDTTEKAIKRFINISNCKVILNINPNINTTMQTTIFIKTTDFLTFDDFGDFINSIQKYIKFYKVSKPIWLKPNILMAHISIDNTEDTLSKYSGNLDVINCSAICAIKQIYNL